MVGLVSAEEEKWFSFAGSPAVSVAEMDVFLSLSLSVGAPRQLINCVCALCRKEVTSLAQRERKSFKRSGPANKLSREVAAVMHKNSAD